MDNLNKTISEVLKDKYIVPLYQRNYAWEQPEISLLLQDIYENFKKSSASNYYIGSLVVLQRKNGDFEVIDGQQRLTTIILIGKVLGHPDLKSANLYYDSRPEVERFYNAFYRSGSISTIIRHEKTAHLYDAVGHIRDTALGSDEKKALKVSGLKGEDLEAFRNYFFEKVIIVRVEIPEDTDVAKYFEIMNNRGEQLQKHEVLKARLLSGLIGNHKGQSVFAQIWDACAQMDTQVHRLFNTRDRKSFFGEEYDRFDFDHEHYEPEDEVDIIREKWTIGKILSGDTTIETSALEKLVDLDVDRDGNAIIDFPNFLMHVLKIEYNKNYKEKTDRDIPLNEKYLLEVYEQIKEEILPLYFIESLFFYRTVFDRFVVRARKKEGSEDNFEWVLRKPNRYKDEKAYRFGYRNTYAQQERLIRSISLLQVTFRSRIYKNWLQSLLSWFKNAEDLAMDQKVFQRKIDNWMIRYFKEHEELGEISSDRIYSAGTNTPHFLFNFIDYLYCLTEPDKYPKFAFRYRNSVEHHRPRSRPQGVPPNIIDCLGNLCLINKNLNSKMNNEDPYSKAVNYGSDINTPKRIAMYEQTKESSSASKWAEKEILAHYHEIIDLIGQKEELLK